MPESNGPPRAANREVASVSPPGLARGRARICARTRKRTARLPNADTPCYGALGGYRLDMPSVAWLMRAGFCASSFDGSRLSARSHQYELGVRAVHAFDLGPRLALDAGAGAGLVYMEQRFDASTRASTRRSGAAFAELVLGLSLDVTRGGYVALDAALQSHVLPMLDTATHRTATSATLTGRFTLGAGMRL